MTTTDLDSNKTIQTLLDAGVAASSPAYIDPASEDVTALITVPDGYRVERVDLEELRAPYRDRPVRKRGLVRVHTVDALVAYHDKHAEGTAEVWIGDEQIVDVLNAHGEDLPEWQDHRAVLTLRYSPEWKRWKEVSGKLLPQNDFAEFLEAAAVDVETPDMATMLEIVQTIVANPKVEWESSYRPHSGQRSFKYKETINAKSGQRGELEIPERLMLALRVFEGQAPQPVPARFRFRITPDVLYLGVVIDRIPELLEQARLAVAAEIESRIERGIVLAGTPSA